MGDEATTTARILDVVLGSSSMAANVPNGDHKQGSRSAECDNASAQQASAADTSDALQAAYSKLFKKYQQLKMKHIAADDALEERIAAVVAAADNLVQTNKKENSVRQAEEDLISRNRWLEQAYNECQNDLNYSLSKTLELKRELGKADLQSGKLLQEVLQTICGFTISSYGKSQILFSHNATGFEFKLEQNDMSIEVGGKDALLYQVVSPGTLRHEAPEWMRSQIIFDMIQVPLFFRRILAVFGHSNFQK